MAAQALKSRIADEVETVKVENICPDCGGILLSFQFAAS